MHWGHYLLLFGAGSLAGALNVLAGGGSFLTLPTLIFLGLPPGVANGTNRVGILLQNLVAVWSFDRAEVLDRGALRWAALPAALGGVAGSLLALTISDEVFQQVLAGLMVVVSLWTLWNRSADDGERVDRRGSLSVVAGFVAVGLYGGFVQAGVGFLILAVTSHAGLDLVRGNAVKVLAVLCLTVLSLAIFIAGGRVDWGYGLTLGAGYAVGGYFGARWTVLKGHRWLRRLVTATILIFAVKLWLDR